MESGSSLSKSLRAIRCGATCDSRTEQAIAATFAFTVVAQLVR